MPSENDGTLWYYEGGNGDIGMIVKSDGTLYGGWNAQVLIMDDVKMP